MGSSFVEFRGRGFWSRDLPLQITMFGLASAIERSAFADKAATLWRDNLRQQMVWGGTGCVWVGTQDLPSSVSVELLADIVRSAKTSRAEWLNTGELQKARVSEWLLGTKTGWTLDAVDSWRPVVDILLAAFLELFDGTIEPEYGQLVYDATSDDAHSRMIPGGDLREAQRRAEAREAVWTKELLASPSQLSSFGPDANVSITFISVPNTSIGGADRTD